ncbi:hypothetical protein ACQ33O_11900 [Ferruginibacter sp. SUN002]|uniref:hypothetical protein n=1 Tax=Ferruginibacter sp. SUN002 TaxID=2937789 RepID=UPI003D36F922
MKTASTAILSITISLLITSCSRTHVPEKVPKSAIHKTVVKAKKPPPPKIITVNHSVATKTPDGRYYYDFQGHRYWRNFDDGRYYLYNKSMYTNPSFKPH